MMERGAKHLFVVAKYQMLGYRLYTFDTEYRRFTNEDVAFNIGNDPLCNHAHYLTDRP
jgi:hypothetical protein